MSDEKDLVKDDQQPAEEASKQVEKTKETVEATTETKVEESVDVKIAKAEEAEENKKERPNFDDGNKNTPHDDFDWSISNRNTLTYTESEQEKFLKDYDQTLGTLTEFEIIKGKVTAINGGDVILDVGYKSDGLLALSEFRGMDNELQIGDLVDVYVESREDENGHLVLSRRKAKLLKAWEMLVDSYDNGTIIKGQVISKTKGGLIVDCGGLETFLPGSQIDIKPITDYDAYVGKVMEYKVVKINEAIKNAVVSHKALIESDLAEQRDAIIGGLEKGQVLEGIVKNITDFGAFMDLGGVDGLLYITDISWGRINHPDEILELNQKLNVVVLDFDEDKKRISLGLKQLQPHPWDVLAADINIGTIVKGKVVNIEDYGGFLEITPGVEGLIHVSEVSWSSQPVNAREYFFLNQEFEAKVVTIDRDERKMSLSVKQLTKDPWEDILEKYPVASNHSGEVKNLTPYGVFVELESGIGGMVHISDLSWTKRFSHPSEFTKVGEKINVQILEIDVDSRKLSLGHKQLEENPWDTFEKVFPVGSYHDATIIKKDDRGAVVSLPYGLEAFAPTKHIRKEDGTLAEKEEMLTVKVIEFNRDDKRIIVSHLRYLQDIRKDAEDEVKKEANQERKETTKRVSKQNSNMEKTTLGELEVFSQLKQQLASEESAAAAAATPAKEEPKAEPAKEEAKVEEVPAAEEKKEEVKAEEVKKEDTPATEEVKEEEKKEEAAVAVAPDNEEVKEETKKETKSETPKAEGAVDDYKKIEGIGPKIGELLHTGGLNTFEDLAKAEVEKLKQILDDAGSRYRMHDPTSWPLQAGMAAEGKWEELEKWQDEHKGGKIE